MANPNNPSRPARWFNNVRSFLAARDDAQALTEISMLTQGYYVHEHDRVDQLGQKVLRTIAAIQPTHSWDVAAALEDQDLNEIYKSVHGLYDMGYLERVVDPAIPILKIGRAVSVAYFYNLTGPGLEAIVHHS